MHGPTCIFWAHLAPLSPQAEIINAGCAGAGVAPYACTGCMATSASLQADFLERVPFNTSAAWKARRRR